MSTNQKGPGRPRVYESASEKISAFRQRQEEAGFLRREVLVTRETVERVRQLAESHGVKPVDVYSALLEYGLESYEPAARAGSGSQPLNRGPEDAAMANPFDLALQASKDGVRRSRADAAVDVMESPMAAVAPEPVPIQKDDPITRFFAKRKEKRNEKE